MRLLCICVGSLLLNASVFAQGFAPKEAERRMKAPDGFEVNLVASEPTIAQPVCIEFDDRGRLWVVQYLQYPNPEGLHRTQVDRFSRTKYDKVPEPPPRGPKGSDRITILEPQCDATGKATSYKSKDFLSNLNLASGIAFGHGGVFVVQVPYLLFYPDKNRDDIPDGDPEVLLTGFGMEDAHSVANSLTWGPDGWLYGCQGSTVTANIRGIEFQQGVWRYHPLTKRFELFCEGGGNSWGLDFDEDGELIYSTNLGPYRNLHGVQGGYYWKSFGKHGALHNPYSYGYFDHIPYQNFVGGHVTDGGIIYQGDSFPAKFRGKYFANDLLGHSVQWHNMEQWGSTFKASYGGELLTPNDTWFAPSDLTMGPDGALYVADWSDKRTAHPDPDADWDRSNGRVYRIQWKAATNTTALPNFQKAPSKDLLPLLASRNEWMARQARRALADRRDVTVYPTLRASIFDTKDEHLALESLWALCASGGADEAFLNDLLDHMSPKIRKWAVRLLGDAEHVSPATVEHLLKIARTETDVHVRSQLASTAKRLNPNDGLALAQAITQRNLDANDPYIPLLLWWAVEKHCVAAVETTLNKLAAGSVWDSTIGRETILPRLIRRYAAEASPETLGACGKILETAPPAQRRTMLSAFNQGLLEQSDSKRISDFAKLPPSLKKQLTSFWKSDTQDELVLKVLTRVHFADATARTIQLAANKSGTADLRVTMIRIIAEEPNSKEAQQFKQWLAAPHESEAVKAAVLDALQASESSDVTSVVLNEYPRMSERLRAKARDVLLSRKAGASALLQQVESGKISPKEISLEQIRQVANHNSADLDAIVRKHWGNVSGGTPEEKLADIRRFNNDLRAAAGNAKRGRDVFLKTCAVCHELFGEGEKVGPELTHANRGDKDFLLVSIVDPNAVIRKEFLNYNVVTRDGRSLNGLIAEQSNNAVTLVGAKNERTQITRDNISSLNESLISLMPEGLLHGLKPDELRDLFAYLQSEKPLASTNSK